MPLIAVEIDGQRVAAARCDDFHVVDARVSGSLVEPQFSTVELTTSTYPESGEGTYLIWLNEIELKAGQVIELKLLSDGEVIGAGKTIEELYPNGDDREPPPGKSINECFRELRLKPNLRAGYNFRSSMPTRANHFSGTELGEFGFGFGLLWNRFRPNRASLSLSTWSIDSVQFDTPSREHFREYIVPGQGGTLRVDA